jgi:hypothetical protein
LNKIKQQKIHNRKIDTVIYEGEANSIIVERSLQDKRFCNSHMFSGEIRPPYTVHHMIVRLELQLPDLTIISIEVELPSVLMSFVVTSVNAWNPSKECVSPPALPQGSENLLIVKRPARIF